VPEIQSDDESYEPIRCFISYARADNETFNGVVDQFKSSLKGLYEAKTGRTLEVFVDRDDLSWGESWRDGIASAVNSATAFIPIISMKYFTREYCREELMAFYENARIVGVTGLLLPVVIAGGNHIQATDPREEVRIIEQLNHVSIESAMLEGYGSGAWLKVMTEITNALIVAVDKAESRIVNRESDTERSSVDAPLARVQLPNLAPVETVNPDDLDGEEDGHFGLFELVDIFGRECEAVRVTGEKAAQDMTAFVESFMEQINALGENPSPQAISKAAPVIARALLETSNAFGSSGRQVTVHAQAADAALRQVISDVKESDVDLLKEPLRQQLEEMRASLNETVEVPSQMEEIRKYIKMLQMVSVSLRRALAPANRGFESVRDAARIVSSWAHLSV
jgi:hypothetical protein